MMSRDRRMGSGVHPVSLTHASLVWFSRVMKIAPRFFFVVAVLLAATAGLAAAQTSWQAEWDKTLRAAESEGQVTLYGCCYDYDRVLEGFKKKYPKIKVSTVLSARQSAPTRILAERRGEKYLRGRCQLRRQYAARRALQGARP